MAEFTGTMLLVIFGAGADCSFLLSRDPAVSSVTRGDWLSVSLGWAIGVATGVWSCAGISGGHINPAITLVMATSRKFPWKKVPGYIFGQLMGGLVGAALVYATYFRAIDIYEGGNGVRTLKTAGIFATYALPYVSDASAFFAEFLATAVFIMVVLACSDRGNSPLNHVVMPVALFLVFLGVGSSLGMQTGFALNPARDLGPRLLTSMVGYGKAVYTFRNQYWIWAPILGPILGAQAGALFYDLFLYNGEDGRFSQRSVRSTKEELPQHVGDTK